MALFTLVRVVACVLILSVASIIAAERPNFLIIYTDDHGYGDVSTYHASDVQTDRKSVV
jgi:hypothetical protein